MTVVMFGIPNHSLIKILLAMLYGVFPLRGASDIPHRSCASPPSSPRFRMLGWDTHTGAIVFPHALRFPICLHDIVYTRYNCASRGILYSLSPNSWPTLGQQFSLANWPSLFSIITVFFIANVTSTNVISRFFASYLLHVVCTCTTKSIFRDKKEFSLVNALPCKLSNFDFEVTNKILCNCEEEMMSYSNAIWVYYI